MTEKLQEKYIKILTEVGRSLNHLPMPLTRATVKQAADLLNSLLSTLNSFDDPEQNLPADNVSSVLWQLMNPLKTLPVNERLKYESLLLPWLNVVHFFLSRTLVKLHFDPSLINEFLLFFSCFIDPSVHPDFNKRTTTASSSSSSSSSSTATTKTGTADVPKLSEEVKHSAIQCLSLILPAQYKKGRYRSSFQVTPFADILEKMKATGDQFYAYVSMATLALLNAARYEHNIQLRVDALRTLSQLLHDNLQDIEVLSSIFPGIASKLVAIISQKPEKENHQIMCNALDTLRELITAVLSDEKNHTLSNITSFNDLFARSTDNKPAISGGNQQVRNEAWFKKVKEDLLPRLEMVLQLRFYPDWHTRLAFVDFSVSILESCARSLDNCIRPLIEMLVLHIDDVYDLVANTCRIKMDLLSKTASFTDTMIPILNEELYDWMMKIPGYLIKRDEQEKANAICLVTGLIILLREEAESTLAMVLPRASDGWMTALQIDKDTLNIMEERQQPEKLIEAAQNPLNGFTSSEALYPKVRFKYAIHDSTVKKLTRLLNCIGKYCNVSTWIRHFMRYLSDGLEECRDPQAAFIIHSLLAGACYFDPDMYENTVMEEWINDSTGEDSSNTQAGKVQAITIQVYNDVMELLTPSVIPNQESASLTAAVNPSFKLDIESEHILSTCFTLKLASLTLSILGKPFVEDQLIYILYPLLSYLGSSHVYIHTYSLITLESIASVCGAGSVQELAINNIDYIINSISQRVSVISSNPRLPLVLKALISVGGYSCVQYLDDTVEEIFDILEAYFDNEFLTSQLCGVLYEIILALQKHFTANRKNEGKANKDLLSLTAGETQPVSKEVLSFIEEQTKVNGNDDEVVESMEEIGKYFLERQQKGLHDNLTLEQSLREQNIPIDTPKDTEEEGQEEEIDIDGKEEDSHPLTHEQEMAKNILIKTSHFLTASSPQIRSQVLSLLTAGVTILSNNTRELNPLVHQMWDLIVNRFDDPQNFVVLNAAIFLERISEISTDFLSARFARDLWPKLKKVIQRGVSAAIADTSFSGYSIYSLYHRTQLSSLKTLTRIAYYVPIKQALVREILEEAKFFYDKANHACVHTQLREACERLFHALATQHPDTVWLYETAYLKPVDYNKPSSPLLDPFSIPAWIKELKIDTKKTSKSVMKASLLNFK